MNRMKIFRFLRYFALTVLIGLIILVFWISVLKRAYYIPVNAMYYQCDQPYISAYQTTDGNVLTTLNKKDYCIDLSIPFANNLHKRQQSTDFKYLLLDFDKLQKVRSGTTHTFFKNPDQTKYDLIQKNAGVFYLNFLDNIDFTKSNPSDQVLYVQPKLSLYDTNLSTVLFKK